LDFRKRVTRSFPKLFKQGDEETDTKQLDFSARTQFAKNWGWYSSIYGLAQGDLTKFDDVVKYGLFKCLTYLSFEAEKNEVEMLELKRYK
jgi:hypothetical protein